MIDTYDATVIFMYCLSALASVVQGISGFGDAIVLHLGWNIATTNFPTLHGTIIGANDVRLISQLMSFRNITLQGCLAYMAKEGFSKKLFKIICPIHCITVIVGSELLQYVKDEILKPILGSVFLVIGAVFVLVKLRLALMECHRQRKCAGDDKSDDALEPQRVVPTSTYLDAEGELQTVVKCAAAIAGAVAGLGQGLSGVGGPPLMIFVLWFQLPPMMVRATIPLSFLSAGLIQFTYGIVRSQYNWAMWLVYIHVVVGGLMGLLLGNHIGRRISGPMFTVFLLSLLFLACLSLLEVHIYVLMIATGVCLVLAAVTHYRITHGSTPPSSPTSSSSSSDSNGKPPTLPGRGCKSVGAWGSAASMSASETDSASTDADAASVVSMEEISDIPGTPTSSHARNIV